MTEWTELVSGMRAMPGHGEATLRQKQNCLQKQWDLPYNLKLFSTGFHLQHVQPY